MVTVIMDRRESDIFKKLLESLGVEVIKRQIQVGDFIVSERTVVERKTRKDLENSIIDGRLFKQLKNLFEFFERVVVIVEGRKADHIERINKKALLGACASIIGDYGASVVFTESYEETVEIIYALAKHEQKAMNRPVYVKGKRKVLSIEEEQKAIVESFPGIGPQTAVMLLKHFGTVRNIVNASAEELMEVKNVGKKKAQIIRKILDRTFF